jgi:hypothetical protein
MTAVWKLLGWRGMVGLAIAAALLVMLLGAKSEARHWKKQSGQWETKFEREHLAFGQTVLNYRAAAEKALKDDAANKARVEAEQAAINERTTHDFEARIADARARADRLRSAQGSANPSGGGKPPVPGSGASAGGAAQATGQGGLPANDALTATEQAIQLDELIKWVRQQGKVDNNGPQPPHK